MAPEVIKAYLQTDVQYDSRVDVWSLGFVFAFLLIGKMHEIKAREGNEEPIHLSTSAT